MTIEHADDIAKLTVLLSPERLAALRQLTGNMKSAIRLHQETLKLGAGLMIIAASIEIALRNAICENLGQHFGRPGWLLDPPAPFKWKEAETKKIKAALDNARRAEYSKLSQAEKHALDVMAFPQGRPPQLPHLRLVRIRREKLQVSEGKIVAELTFHMWKRLCGPDYEHSLWKPTLKRVFPHKKVKRASVADHLENLYQTRNRLAHHEPVLHGRFTDAVNAIKFITQHLQADSPSDQTALARLIADDLANVEQRGAELHAKLNSYRV